MKSLIIDTETSGLMNFKEAADAPGQPRVCSLAALLVDSQHNVISHMNFLIKPIGWTFDNDCEAAEINGFTHERLMDEGISINDVLDAYNAITDLSDVIVGYNVAFDQKMIRAEYRHACRDDRYGYRPTFDTMYRGQKVARAIAAENPSLHGNPKKLTEVYETIFRVQIGRASCRERV